MNYKVETNSTYRGLNILPCRRDGEEKRTDILDRLRSILFCMLDKHCKVIQTRFDLHYPDIQDFEHINRDIYHFINEFTKALNRMNCSGHYVDAKYLWVREQSLSVHPHYHVVVFCNGNAIKSPYTIFDKAEYYWSKTISYPDNKLVDRCYRNNGFKHENGIMMDINKYDFESQLNKAFRASSYLAKTGSKESREKYACSSGSSHISSEYCHKSNIILSKRTLLITEKDY